VQRGVAVMQERHDKNREKPAGESWNILFGKEQFKAR